MIINIIIVMNVNSRKLRGDPPYNVNACSQ